MAEYDVPAAVEETAKAVQSVSETSRGLGNSLAAVMGEAPYTVGQIVNDRLQAFRFNKMVDYKVAAKKRLEVAGLRAEDLQLPPPTIEVPLLAAASLEDRDELCELWEKLLAAAMAPATRNRVRARHIQILQQLEPLDAFILPRVDLMMSQGSERFTKEQANPEQPRLANWSFLSYVSGRYDLDRYDVSTSLSALEDLKLVGRGAFGNSNSDGAFITPIGRNFLNAVDPDLNPQ